MRRLLAAYREAYRGLPRCNWVLAAVCFVNRAGTMVLPFLALYLTSRRGLSTTAAGVVLSLYGAGAGVGTFWGGRLSDRFGPKHVQVASLGLAGLGFVLLGQLEGTTAIRLVVFALAVANEAFRPANSAAFAAQAPRERWTQAFSLRRLALNLGMTCGPALGGVLAAHDYGLLFLVDGGTCILAAVLLALLDRSPAPAGARVKPPAAASPWRDGAFLALLGVAVTYSAVLYQFFSTYPLALRELHHLREPQIGSVYAINTVLIVVCEMLLVRRLAGRPPLRIAAWGMLFFCGGFALLPFGRGYLFVAATVVVWTLGEMLTMPFLETTVAERGDPQTRGAYLGTYSFAFSISFAGAPLLGAYLYQHFGPMPLFAGFGAVGALNWLALRALASRFAVSRHHASAPAETLASSSAAAPPAA